jgi:hypothetical protein
MDGSVSDSTKNYNIMLSDSPIFYHIATICNITLSVVCQSICDTMHYIWQIVCFKLSLIRMIYLHEHLRLKPTFRVIDILLISFF